MDDTVRDIILKLREVSDKFSELEKEINNLKSENRSIKGVLAAVMKRVERIDDFNIKEIYKSNYDNVKFIHYEDKSEVSIAYIDEGK